MTGKMTKGQLQRFVLRLYLHPILLSHRPPIPRLPRALWTRLMPASKPPRYPRTSQLVWWPFAALLVLVVVSELAVDAAGGGEGWNQIAAAAWYLGWGVWAVYLCRRIGIGRLVGPLPKQPGTWGYAAMALPLLLFSAGLVSLQMVLASWMAPGWVREWLIQEETAPVGPMSPTLALELLKTVALAPVVEEFVFRGILLRSWTGRRGITTAIFGTSALFAVLHPGDLLGSFVFGVVLCVIRLRSCTLLVPIACHVLFNGLASLLGAGSIGASGAAVTMEEMRSLWWVGAVCVASAAPVLWIFLHRNWPRRRSHQRSPHSSRGSVEVEDVGGQRA